MIINVENLTKTFESYERGNSFKEAFKSLFVRKTKVVEALKGISFSIKKGELVGFLGPNGAGKSTTLKVLTGILFPTDGKVDIMGYTPWKDRKKYVAHIGAVFGQKSQLLWDIPPLDAFNLNKAIYSIPDSEFNKKLNYMVEMLSLQDLVKKPTRLLSLGERMKCEFIMAMLHNPEIVFLDEPTIGLDVIAKDKIREFIIEMNKQGVTFILTTHDLEDVERLAERVIVINHGEMVFDNSIDALKGHLGTKKMVSITTHGPLPLLDMPGVLVKNKLSEYNVELELDVSVMDLNKFIDYINRNSTLSDMSLQELPIEEVIKDLYT
ncbi:ABC transporter ATP-binding protein [Pseudobacteroides cellulosolvens]|uniref:ABC transporter related protein n=1 Tax=Pseudobacteroides cellulosolvens ATCC 35603 = DSM 2933 TaxID=398512 RepID=A0A0L6JHT1_9FIRM|nr:ATP-binding cassette domain-containing protein [Pseudobacteroides cellulosolvens]KNY25260.1 ABC transporter related protein [Pseudobacteroides cellulosolvens ATCC 35603 = DSM 2933]